LRAFDLFVSLLQASFEEGFGPVDESVGGSRSE